MSVAVCDVELCCPDVLDDPPERDEDANVDDPDAPPEEDDREALEPDEEAELPDEEAELPDGAVTEAAVVEETAIVEEAAVVSETEDMMIVVEGEDTTRPLPMVESLVHMEEEGIGWAAGVTGSPWWNVEVPYTPIGCKVSQR